MRTKNFLFIFLALVTSVLLVSCSGDSTSGNDAQIQSQMNRWVEAWENEDSDTIRETMLADGLSFTFDDVEENNLTIDNFITIFDEEFFYYVRNQFHFSEIVIDRINSSDSTSILKADWEIGDDLKRIIFSLEVQFKKIMKSG